MARVANGRATGKAGPRPGDVIVAVNREPVRSVETQNDAVDETRTKHRKPVLLLVSRLAAQRSPAVGRASTKGLDGLFRLTATNVNGSVRFVRGTGGTVAVIGAKHDAENDRTNADADANPDRLRVQC